MKLNPLCGRFMKLVFVLSLLATNFSQVAAATGDQSAPAIAQGSDMIWSQGMDGWTTFYSSVAQNGSANYEATDDIDVVANIDRVVATAYVPTIPRQIFGANVNFYAYNIDGTPGVLQAHYVVNTGDPGFIISQGGVNLDIPISPPFPAAGRHFISVQPILSASPAWSWWSSNKNNVRGQAVYTRTDNGAWSHPISTSTHDLAFVLYGTLAGSSTVSSIVPSTQTRSGRILISGVNFGNDGQVLVDGLTAAVASWTDGLITAYVPEAARLGNVPVQVVTAGGMSAAVSMSVTARQPNGRVKWRLQLSAPYTYVRPAVAPDGTIYAVDVYGHLYALAPDGALKWLVRNAGSKGVTVGVDGSVYTGDENAIKAFNPNGTIKWSFVQNPRANILLGPNVGPDGNIYAVGTQGIGVFSLTPNGALRWTQPENYDRPIINYQELVFGPNGANQQLYFHANNHFRGLRLDGTAVFTLAGGGSQPATSADGTIYLGGLLAYNPSGALKWSYPGSGYTPYVGTDNVIYFASTDGVTAINPDGSFRWKYQTFDILGDPVANPVGNMVVFQGQTVFGTSGYIQGISTANQQVLWRVDLQPEGGLAQVRDSRARFSVDSKTAYLTTQFPGQTSDQYGYLNAIDTTVTSPPPPAAPSLLTASISGASVVLNWQDNSSNELGFYIERCEGAGCTSFTGLAGTSANVSTYPDSSVAAGITYRYRVVAYNAGGYSAYSNIVSIAVGTSNPSPTPVPTNTPIPPTATNTPAASTSTGFLSASANAAQTSSAGDNNGYQTSPANAYANDSSFATDTNSGTNTNTACTNSGKDKHRYYNYNFNIPVTAVIKGIQVRLDARADATSGSPKICVQLSWDGGTTWTTAKSTTNLGTTETTYTLGSSSDTWSRTWTSGNFSNTNFRIRLIDVASNTSRDFFLDYVAVNVTYQP